MWQEQVEPWSEREDFAVDNEIAVFSASAEPCGEVTLAASLGERACGEVTLAASLGERAWHHEDILK